MRSFAVKGTVFLLIVGALIIAGSTIVLFGTIGFPDIILASGLVTAVVYLIVAYVCWNQRRWGFVAAIILALITTAGTLAFSVTGFEALSVEGFLLIVPQLLLILFGYRAYREGKGLDTKWWWPGGTRSIFAARIGYVIREMDLQKLRKQS